MTPEQQQWLEQFKLQSVEERRKILRGLVGKQSLIGLWKIHRNIKNGQEDLVKEIFFKEEDEPKTKDN
jgi:hypothetical protein